VERGDRETVQAAGGVGDVCHGQDHTNVVVLGTSSLNKTRDDTKDYRAC
jgi:hypothetical protein